jgi:hypothetical protein
MLIRGKCHLNLLNNLKVKYCNVMFPLFKKREVLNTGTLLYGVNKILLI